MQDNNGLVEAIRQKQLQEDLNLSEMATKLGISHSYLTRVYKGERRPGRKFLAGVYMAYPDLRDSVDLFLSSSVTQVPGNVTPVA